MKLLAVVAHLWAFAYQVRAQQYGALGVITPLAEYTSTLAGPNNQQLSARTITFECYEGLTTGTLMVGNYEVGIECIPPRYQYYYDQVGTIPQAVQLMESRVCLAGSDDVFALANAGFTLADLQAQVNASNALTGNGPLYTTNSVHSQRHMAIMEHLKDKKPVESHHHARRRGMQTKANLGPEAKYVVGEFDDIAKIGLKEGEPEAAAATGGLYAKLKANAPTAVKYGLGAAALGGAVYGIASFNVLNNKVNDLDNAANSDTNALQDASDALKAQIGINEGFNASIVGIQKQLLIQQDTNTQVQYQLGNLTNATDILRQQAQNNFNILSNQTVNGLYILQTQLNSSDSAIKAQLSALWQSLGQFGQSQINDNNDIAAQQELINENLAGVNSILYDQQHNRQLRNALNQLFFGHKGLLGEGVVPLVSDPGIAPSPTGDLPPQYQVLKLEELNFDFANQVQSSTQLTNVKLTVYYNTTYALNVAKPFATFQQILNQIGTPGCVRAGIWNNQPAPNCFPDGPGGNDVCCAAWVQADVTTCTASTNNFVYSKQANPFTQQATLNTVASGGACTASPGAPTTTLLFSPVDVFTFINQYVCLPASQSNNQEYFIQAILANRMGFFNAANASVCATTYTAQMQSAPNSAFRWFAAIVELVYPTLGQVLNMYNQVLYGRLPGGLSFDVQPFVYNPVTYDTFGNPVYDPNADPLTCTRAFWTSATEAVIPVYSMTPVPGATLQKSVAVNLTYAGDPSAQSASGSVPVPAQLDIYAGNGGSIMLDDDASNLLPGNMLVVGDVHDVFLYDVPSVLLDVSKTAAAREGKLTYYLMDSNTTSTWSLQQWINTYGDVYDAQQAAINPLNYLYLSVTAPDGYPVCDVTGGLPSATQLQGLNVQPVCASPFARVNATFPVVPQASNSQCSYTASVIYGADPTVNSAASTFNAYGLTWESGTYTVAFQIFAPGNAPTGLYAALAVQYPNGNQVTVGVSTSTSTTTASGSAWLQLVVANGAAINVLGKQNLVDGYNHHVALVVNNGAGTVSIYIDGFLSETRSVSFSGFSTGSASSATWTTPSPSSVVGLTLSKTSTGSLDIQRLMLCQQSAFVPHCADPAASTGTTQIIAYDISAVNSGTACMASTKLYTTALYETYQATPSQAATLFTQAAWTVGFWYYEQAVAASTTVQLWQLTGPSNSITLQQTGNYIFASLGSPNVASTVVNIGTSMLGTGAWHYIALTYANNQVLFYVDSVQTGFATFTFGAGGGYNGYGPGSSVSTTSVADIRYYASALAVNSIYAEQTCQTAGSVYAPPVSRCRLAAASSNSPYAYCRNPSMCSGNCEQLATLSQTAQTFTVSSNACDNGYNAPLCLAACSMVDLTTGACIVPNQMAGAGGIIPNGEWCLFLRNYMVSTGHQDPDSGRQTIYATPRSWAYTATIQIPQGQIITEVATSVCPTVDLSGNGQTVTNAQNYTVADGVAVILTNPGATTGSYQVIQGQSLSDGARCSADPSCCQPDGNGGYVPISTVVQIPAFAKYAVQIGACVNMTIDVQVQNVVNGQLVWQDCTSLSADFVNAQVQQISNLPSEVESALVIQQSQTQQQQAVLTASLYANLLSFMAASSPVIASSEAFQAYVQSQIAAVNNISINPANFSALFPAFTLGGAQYQYDLGNISAAAKQVASNTQQQQQLSAEVIAELQKLPGLFASLAGNVSDMDTQIAAARAALDKYQSEKIDLPSLPSLPSLPGLPDISLPSLSKIVEVLGIGALCVVGFFVGKALLGCLASRSANAAYSRVGGEPDIIQSKTVKRFKNQWDSGAWDRDEAENEAAEFLTRRRQMIASGNGKSTMTPSQSDGHLSYSR